MHYHLQLQKKTQQPKLANTSRSAYTKRTTNKTMEKLLSSPKKQGGNYANDVISLRTKKFSQLSRARKFFASTQANSKKSTLFRMYYLSQPITGLLLKPVNFF